MAYEAKDNSGSIFANDRKEKDTHPDGKGSAMIGGVEYWVSSWNKKTQEGKSWRSLSFTPKDGQTAQQAPQTRTEPPPYRKPSQDAAKARQAPQRGNSGGFEDMDSDIPFSDPMKNRAYALSV